MGRVAATIASESWPHALTPRPLALTWQANHARDDTSEGPHRASAASQRCPWQDRQPHRPQRWAFGQRSHRRQVRRWDHWDAQEGELVSQRQNLSLQEERIARDYGRRLERRVESKASAQVAPQVSVRKVLDR